MSEQVSESDAFEHKRIVAAHHLALICRHCVLCEFEKASLIRLQQFCLLLQESRHGLDDCVKSPLSSNHAELDRRSLRPDRRSVCHIIIRNKQG